MNVPPPCYGCGHNVLGFCGDNGTKEKLRKGLIKFEEALKNGGNTEKIYEDIEEIVAGEKKKCADIIKNNDSVKILKIVEAVRKLVRV